jgi:hypothetical protein
VVAVFGAIVLLFFPDRPGGTFSFVGFNVDSKGAGFPLIALGLLVVFAAFHLPKQVVPPTPGPAPTSARISLSPPEAHIKETFIVSGFGFPPNTQIVRLKWRKAGFTSGPITLATVSTRSEGSFQHMVSVPNVNPAIHEFCVYAAATKGQGAASTFQTVAPFYVLRNGAQTRDASPTPLPECLPLSSAQASSE